jgi:signal transduction histidine kinase
MRNASNRFADLLGNAIKFTERGRVSLRLGPEDATFGKARVQLVRDSA